MRVVGVHHAAFAAHKPGKGYPRFSRNANRQSSGSGNGSKQLLVRAIGPGLVQFGVPGTLADPRIDIIPQNSPTILFSNDNWSKDSAMDAATAAAGAFPLTAGSKDAAVLAALSGNGDGNTVASVKP